MFRVKYTKKFARRFKKLTPDIKELAARKEDILVKNPFDQRLKTHKLFGNLHTCWAFSINHHYRVIFTFEGDKIIFFLTIGDHDIYNDVI